MQRTLYDKIFDAQVVRTETDGRSFRYVDLMYEACRQVAEWELAQRKPGIQQALARLSCLGAAGVSVCASRITDRQMTETVLNPVLGYDQVARITAMAVRQGTTPRAAALALSCIDTAEYDRLVDPVNLAGYRPIRPRTHQIQCVRPASSVRSNGVAVVRGLR